MELQPKGGHEVATVVKASACGLSLASATSAWLLHPGLAFNDHFQPHLPSWWSFQPSLHKYLTSSGEMLPPGGHRLQRGFLEKPVQAELWVSQWVSGDVCSRSPGKLRSSLPDRPGGHRTSPLSTQRLAHLWEPMGFALCIPLPSLARGGGGGVHSWCSVNAYYMNALVHLFLCQIFLPGSDGAGDTCLPPFRAGSEADLRARKCPGGAQRPEEGRLSWTLN